MNATSACPNSKVLQAYLLGQTGNAQAAAIEQHLARCLECRKRLPSIPAEDDFVKRFRGQAGRPQPSSPQLDDLVQRLHSLVQTLPTEDLTAPLTQPTPSLCLEDTQEMSLALGPAQQHDEIGRLGGYRILTVLGRGGMGVVYKAEDSKLKRIVAVKSMLSRQAADPAARQRFLREAQAMAAVHHDHIATIFQVDEDNGVPFLAMEFLEGTSLDQWLKAGHKPTVAQTMRIGREIAEGLAAAHARGLIHRDVKPANIWLDAAHNGRVKILDFGLAYAGTEEVHLTGAGVIVGTPAYMAPEQARAEPVDARSDLFSLGCLLYLLCTGKKPFSGDSTISLLTALAVDRPKPLRDLNPEAPAGLADLVMQLLEKDPAKRPQSARAVVEALQAVEHDSSDERTAVVVPVVSTRSARTSKRRPWVVALATAAFLAIIIVGAVVIIRDRHGNEIAKIPVPPGGDVLIEKDGKKTEAADAWMKQVAALPADKQVEAVTAELRARNPGFDGKVQPVIRDGGVTRLDFSTEQVTDISPIRALTGLRTFGANLTMGKEGWTKGRLADLSPLRNLNLTALYLEGTQVSDLSPLKGMPLRALNLQGTKVSDLSPLKGAPLTDLNCAQTGVSDLSPLTGAPLTKLYTPDTKISDLSPLKDMKLRRLNCGFTSVADLSPLKGMPLESLGCDATRVSDLSPLKGMKLSHLSCNVTRVSSLSPVKDAPLTDLSFRRTLITDLSPLKGMPLQFLECDFKPERDAAVLRSIPTLKEINNRPVADFWKDADGEKPGK